MKLPLTFRTNQSTEHDAAQHVKRGYPQLIPGFSPIAIARRPVNALWELVSSYIGPEREGIKNKLYNLWFERDYWFLDDFITEEEVDSPSREWPLERQQRDVVLPHVTRGVAHRSDTLTLESPESSHSLRALGYSMFAIALMLLGILLLSKLMEGRGLGEEDSIASAQCSEQKEDEEAEAADVLREIVRLCGVDVPGVTERVHG